MLKLPDSIHNLIQLLENASTFSTPILINWLKNAAITQEDLLPWTDFEHPVADSYGRKIIAEGKNYELMVMSWIPGDFSGIHDHGSASCGAVQVFGPAEHAVFEIKNNALSTLDRWDLKPLDILGINHSLIHQMGNPIKNLPFVSLHVYAFEKEIGPSRLFDLQQQKIQFVAGGVFFALPKSQILKEEKGPQPDFPTKIRYLVEWGNRLKKMGHKDDEVTGLLQTSKNLTELIQYLLQITDEKGHFTHSRAWSILLRELKAWAGYSFYSSDRFDRYAEVYDKVIAAPCMDAFVFKNLSFIFDSKDLSAVNLLSIGCGTGFTEQILLDQFNFSKNQILGIDISPAMVEVASKRIPVIQADLLEWEPINPNWEFIYSGLNVFQYLPCDKLDAAIAKTASLLKSGGTFFGDFITPDHIRWYPNLIISEDRGVISLRTPKLVDQEGLMFQESEIVNIYVIEGNIELHYAGKHKRYLPPMHRVRNLFEKHFGKNVQLYDAVSMKLLSETADTCPSTRYLVVAGKQ
jgi:SAM-dependent methyltransferase